MAAGVLLCGLAGAVLVAARGGGTVPVEGLAAVWRPFPVQGLNEKYSKLPPSFEAAKFEPGQLPHIGFSTAPAGGWDGQVCWWCCVV